MTHTASLSDLSVVLHVSGIDGSLVVQINTDDRTGTLRVYLNDGALWNGDPETHHHEDCECVTTWERRPFAAVYQPRKD